MKVKDLLSDPEAVALSKVYALLIQVARQRKAIQIETSEAVEIENAKGTAMELPQSKDLASIPLSIAE